MATAPLPLSAGSKVTLVGMTVSCIACFESLTGGGEPYRTVLLAASAVVFGVGAKGFQAVAEYERTHGLDKPSGDISL